MRTIASQADWKSVAAGEAVVCGYESQCSACLQHGEKRLYQADAVVLANITKVVGGWHGWWSCMEHWSKSAVRRRLESTGSVTP